jgi:amino acid transporter
VWEDGGLPQIAQNIAPWLGGWVLVGASFAVLGEFNAVMGTSSRALQKMAEYGLMPRVLGGSWARFKTPVPAILLQAVLCGLLMNFSFEQLVVLDTAFNNVSLVMEVAAFLRLKHQHPDLPRPYAVPGRLVGAWVMSIPKFGVILFGFFSLGLSWQLAVVAGANVCVAVLSAWWCYRHTAGVDVLDCDDPVKVHLARMATRGEPGENPDHSMLEVVALSHESAPQSPLSAADTPVTDLAMPSSQLQGSP